MNGHEIAELLPFYANGTLDDADRARVETELASCASCAAELRDLQSIGAALRARADAAPPVPLRALDAALDRIAPAAATHGFAPPARWWSWPARYATAATLVVGLGASAFAAYHGLLGFGGGAGQRAFGPTAAVTVVRANDDAAVRTGRNDDRAVQQASGATSAVKTKVAAAQPAAPEHRLARKARLELLVRDVEATLKAAQDTVRAHGGDVTSMNDATPRSAEAVHGATLEAEVPATRLDAALDRLASLGAVQTRAVDAEDVADAIVDEEARLRNLRREENDLRALMDKGGKVEDILDVQQHLAEVRGQIEQLDAQHQHDVHRVATSTISLSLTEDRPNATPAKPGPTARIDGAWHAGITALGDIIVSLLAAIVWCVALAPLALAIGGLGYIVVRTARRFAHPSTSSG